MSSLLALLTLALPAQAGPTPRLVLPRSVDERPMIELRGGVDSRPRPASEGPASPYICGELTPLRRVGVEGCGNGAGVLQNSDLSDFAHFRVRVTALQRTVGQWNMDVVTGVGWAEVQRGQDAAGFRFGAAQPGQVEAAVMTPTSSEASAIPDKWPSRLHSRHPYLPHRRAGDGVSEHPLWSGCGQPGWRPASMKGGPIFSGTGIAESDLKPTGAVMPIDFPRFAQWMDHHPHGPPTNGIPPWVRETFAVHWTTNATPLAPFLKRSPWLLALADELGLGDPYLMVDGHGLAPTDIATLAALNGAVPSVTTRARNGDGFLTVGITES